MALDVKRAFLHGKARRHIYIKLPKEDPRYDGGKTIGRLLKSMYGTRDAPQIWAGEVKRIMESMGFRACRINPCIFYHEDMDLQVITHVDDFLCCGEGANLRWLRDELMKTYEITGDILGNGKDETTKLTYLKRTIGWTPDGLTYEASETYVPRLLEEWSMTTCSPVSTPGVKVRVEQEKPEPLSNDMASKYKRAAATLNYLSLDRPDISFSSKELSRKMTDPDEGDIVALKRLLRYLQGCKRLIWHFPWQEDTNKLDVLADSDWAGCTRTRRSTSGGILQRGRHLLHHWSKTQATVALSSGEAELNAALKGAAEGLFLQGITSEMQEKDKLTIFGDSTASRGILLREGSAPLKHLHVKQLWVQEHVARKAMDVVKIPRAENPADALTHHWSAEAAGHYASMGLRRVAT